jgi:hypothetical protein
VLDVDIEAGKVDGRDSLRALGLAPVQTRAHLTPRGGLHLLYRLEEGEAGPTDAGALGPGLDRRGDGGYIIWYPAHGGSVVIDCEPAGAPAWLVAPVIGNRDGSRRIVTREQAEEIAADLLADVRGAGAGARNVTLSRSAFIMGQLVEAGLIDMSAAGNDLLEAADAVGLERRESVRVIDRGLKRGGERPGFEDAETAPYKWFSEPPKWIERARFVRAGTITREPKPIVWLIDGYLEGGVVADLFGASYVGKSLIALDWSACVATGSDWNGRKVQKGPVVYIAGEGEAGLRRRLRAWEIERGRELGGADLFVSDVTITFRNASDVAGLFPDLDQIRPKMVVIDTESKIAIGMNINDHGERGAFMAACWALRNRYGCVVLIVTHSGVGEGAQGRAAGSFNLKGQVDTEFGVFGDDDNEGKQRLHCCKMKDADEPPDQWFERVTVKLGGGWEGSESVALRPCEEPDSEDDAENDQRLAAAMGGVALPIGMVRKAFMDLAGGAIKAKEARKAAWRRAVRRATAKGWAVIVGDEIGPVSRGDS